MKLGIIIIFRNNADKIDIEAISKSLKSVSDLVLCVVDNQSKDDTLEKLKEVRENSSNVEVVEIKKHSTLEAAKKAGARFMFNTYNLKHLGFIDVNAIEKNTLDVNNVIELVCQSQGSIIDFDKELKRETQVRQTFFKSIFSVLDFLKQNHLNNSSDTTFLSTT
ncbi:hypothetical protein BTO05_11305 [Winogradskyella sp. PC-19]|uniref:glycosyltransferase family A protein n=1 Tax=unclassified Winogradskyella TaxID=2615021 RepID=UPI000B3D3B59|nr:MULTISPECIES: glycosyltransferase family A protein [unclassified Winogradskyella]ARV10194.1 hypothetical protein BTO05_11305 [Winogradskyella sp. PC-19]RZN82096.1 MAG: glycosyltransferase family 2 protein [Winogradskyella sp.]